MSNRTELPRGASSAIARLKEIADISVANLIAQGPVNPDHHLPDL